MFDISENKQTRISLTDKEAKPTSPYNVCIKTTSRNYVEIQKNFTVYFLPHFDLYHNNRTKVETQILEMKYNFSPN